MYSTTAAVENGQRGRSCTCDPSVPSRVRWLLRYALRNGGPEGVCTLSLPADNGLLRCLSCGSVKWLAEPKLEVCCNVSELWPASAPLRRGSLAFAFASSEGW